MNTSTCELLGVQLNALSIEELNKFLESAVGGRFSIIANHNLHSLYLYHQDPRMRDFYSRATCTHVDGMGIVLLANLLGVNIARDQRVTYVDWVPSLMQLAAQRGWRIFYLGSKPGVAATAAQRLQQCYPGAVIETAHGYFDPHGPDNSAILDRIRSFAPNILMVGMGMPRQELWVLDNLDSLSPMVVLTSGAAFDYFAGAVPTPPRWAGRVGLEWLFRLVAEPRRLWKRYLVEPWLLLPVLIRYWVTNSPKSLGSTNRSTRVKKSSGPRAAKGSELDHYN